MFFPGKAEILAMKMTLMVAGVDERNIDILHSELPAVEIDRVKSPRSNARVVLSTNFAEKAVTIVDVDIVLDSGMARCAASISEYFEPYDYCISWHTHCQRSGRVGRVKPGASIFIQATECYLPQGRPVSQESICRVVALQSFPEAIALSSCKLCKVSEELVAEAEQTNKALGLTQAGMLDALSKVSLNLGDAAVLLHARRWGVAYEAAAILSLKESGERYLCIVDA